MFFTLTSGIGVSAGAADGAPNALGVAGKASGTAGAADEGATAEGATVEVVESGVVATLGAGGAVDATAFDAAAELSGAEAPEHALNAATAMPTHVPRENCTIFFMLLFIPVFLDPRMTLEAFSLRRCVVRAIR